MRGSKVHNFRRRNGAVEADAPSTEKDFASSIKAATEVPPSSFKFYVWSDAGINLHVDLNSSPSDWTNKFKNEVHISENVYGNKSRSLWQELGCLGESSTHGRWSSLCNANSGQLGDRNEHPRSSQSLKLTKDIVADLDQQYKGESPVISDSLTPCSFKIKVTENFKENQSSALAELTVNVADNSKQDQSTISDEEVGEIVDGLESSECSQLGDPLKKSGLDSDDQVSKMKLGRKRKTRDSEIQGSSGKPSAGILRSMKNNSALVLPSPRRSMRLISK